MKKFNLFKEIIVVQRVDFMNAINSNKKFAITHEGKIEFEPFSPTMIAIFEGTIPPRSPLSPNLQRPLTEILGKDYRIVEDDDRILIKASPAWQSIIGYNRIRSLYDDTTADGIDKFADKELEQIGWYATEFNITYREIVEQFESQCEGTVICIEQEEPYQFSGLGFVSDIEQARKVAFDFCVSTIQEKLVNDPDYATLSGDEEEAKNYFLS
ncbi:hypothetical protein [Sulfuricurvum sp.]|uniref:hypothetical protein n=1 Tax=Sulfuricurvum sp. TaxID=2025608 RepID=UPI001989986C|nr:hypothetical protein [Sulfuricurvum sp.]MBD3798845.1 hypothetical protein [Campylobacterota bacterium]MBD3805877.1 hypothetical protein [Sulfuricurvum sp.]